MDIHGSGFSRYDRKEPKRSIYCYEGTQTLINKENIKDAKALAEYEADITLIRQYEIEKEGKARGRFTVSHLKHIHKYIFQDIYPFAGKFRKENISKGTTVFYKVEYIEENLKRLLDELKREHYLQGLNAKVFSQRAAYYLAEINMVHPFREGNGRTIREFLRQLAHECGYVINWSHLEGHELLSATILSVEKNYVPLSDCIYKTIENIEE